MLGAPPSVISTGAAAIANDVCASLSVIVDEAAAVPIVGATTLPDGVDNVTVTFSRTSSSASSVVTTLMVLLVSPSRKMTVPLSALLMSPASKSPVTA